MRFSKPSAAQTNKHKQQQHLLLLLLLLLLSTELFKSKQRQDKGRCCTYTSQCLLALTCSEESSR